MKPINVGIIGMGYIGESHIEAVRRIGMCRLVAVADTNAALAKDKAELYGIEKAYSSVEEMLADEKIDAIHNCTPNFLHTEINTKILRAGKHLLSEKPLSDSYEGAMTLVEEARKHPGQAVAVNYNYRMNPMVQDMKYRIRRGELGALRVATGSYQQDWLTDDTDWSWRLDPKVAGHSCAIADIGSHWMDLFQYVSGQRITEVCADLKTVIPVRKKPLRQVETFTAGSGAYEEVRVENEEYGAVLFHTDAGVTGVFHVSEVAPGHGCYFNVEINGEKASFRWCQEENDRLWIGRRDGDNSYIIRAPGKVAPEARPYTALAMGHPEGWNDAFKNNLAAFYRYIGEGMTGEPVFATPEQAAYLVRLTEKIVESSKKRGWVNID